MSFACKILADSVGPTGSRLTTLEVTFPRIVLAEFNTHRMLSRNSASSRAIPVEKRIAQVESNPFMPAAFGKNRPGMQATETLDACETLDAAKEWQAAKDAALHHASRLAALGVHKQLANRLLEPFLWHTVIVSATEWSNFFALRCHPDAQPEIRTIAEMMRSAMADSSPVYLHGGIWHLPLVPDVGELLGTFSELDVAMISAGRCARVSYLTHDGKRDPVADLALAAKLRASGHMSPFEHVAYATDEGAMIGNFRDWYQLRKRLPFEHDFSKASRQ